MTRRLSLFGRLLSELLKKFWKSELLRLTAIGKSLPISDLTLAITSNNKRAFFSKFPLY
jgi:hypothetical protein